MKRNDHYKLTTCQDWSENEFSLKYSKIESKTNCLFLSFWRSKQKKRTGCSKILEEQCEAKGISPTFSKSKVKWIGLFQKFGKTKQLSEPFKILQDRSKTNVFVPNCGKKEKRKNEASFFLEKSEYNRSSTIEDLPLLIKTSA